MIAIPDAQLNHSYQLLKLATPLRNFHFRRWCISWFSLMYTTFVNISQYYPWYHFKGDPSTFHLRSKVNLSEQPRGHWSSLNCKKHTFLHHFRLNNIPSFRPGSSRNNRATIYHNQDTPRIIGIQEMCKLPILFHCLEL